ncbi:MAG TPA: hypothetical protein VMW54_07130 [Terriglobia bacterium]|nr:hypothetical protein [Terriglobia bacterium]
MVTALQQRKVLIFGDEPSIRNLLHIFAEKLKRQNAGTQDPAAALTAISRQSFDEVLLDLRCSNPKNKNGARGIGEIQPSLMGRVLVIAAEVSDPETMDLVERYLLNGLPRSLLWLVSNL